MGILRNSANIHDDATGELVGYINPVTGEEAPAAAGVDNGDGSYSLTIGGAVAALSETVSVVTMTATGTAFTGACGFRGLKVRALVGGPQTATIYDATSATGTPIDTVVFNDLGTWFWDRPSDLLPGAGGRRINSTGLYAVYGGGTSRTVDVMVE